MNFKYYPDEIAAALAKAAGETSQEIINQATEELYNLKAICENELNSEYRRTFYKLLEEFTENNQ